MTRARAASIAMVLLAAVAAVVAPAELGRPARHLVPARYADLVLPLPAERPRWRNLVYEAQNVHLRGARDAVGMYADGRTVARRWRHVVRDAVRVFALRDGIFAQQDHVIEQDAYAVMMPVSWVTAALAELAAGRALRAVGAPPLEDEAVWRALEPAELFGSFPPSRWLLERATAPADGPDASGVRQARRALRALATDAAAMIAAQAQGADAVAAAGAERIAWSDRRYFGAALRRARLILVAVENPLPHELVVDGKSPYVPGRPDIAPEIVARARDAVYRRRLADGDIALERYDVSRVEERRRAIAVLEALVPRDRPAPGGLVWLWIAGPDGPRAGSFAVPSETIATFRDEIAAANVDAARVRLLPRPALALPEGPGRRAFLEEQVDRFRALALPFGVRIDAGDLAALIAAPPSGARE